jgi:imidazolonepropionase-like amidohydrolase
MRSVLLGVALLLSGSAFAAGGAPTLVKAGRLLDVRAGRLLAGQALLVENDKIVEVGPAEALAAKLPPGARVIDLSSKTVLPGLIDAHAHLLDAMSYRLRGWESLLVTVAGMSPAKRALLGAGNARETVMAGITTVRNVGHSGRNGDVALRDAVNEGWVVGPRILASGRKLAPPGGQAMPLHSAIAPQIVDEEFRVIAGVDDARRAVREALHEGVDLVKVVLNDEPPRLSTEEVRAVVDEAHRAKIKVAAHAAVEPAVRIAVDAGVDSVEHGDEATDEELRLMKEKGIFLVATDLWETGFLTNYPKIFALEDADRARLEKFISAESAKAASRLARARKLGVRIAAGSDNWFRVEGKTRGEATLVLVEALAKERLPAADVIRAMTVDAAELLGWGEKVGTLEAGRFADVIAVAGDPLADVTELERAVFVMKGGEVLKGP